jgi:two-component system cell cycle sensor histidine kinase/response regulator CckA
MTASRDGAASQPSLHVSRIDGARMDVSPTEDTLRALAASEDRLRGIVDAIPDLIFRCDAEGRLVDGNFSRAEDLLVPPESFLGKRLRDVLPHPIPERFAAALALARKTGRPQPFEYELDLPQRGREWYEARVVSLADGGAYILVRNVSENHRLRAAERQSHEQLQAFFSQSIDGCFFMMLDEPVEWHPRGDPEAVLDYVFAHQRLTQVNDAMVAQYGATRDELLGLTPQDFFRHDLAHGRQLWRRMFDAGKVRLERDERKADGMPMWIEGEYIVLHDAAGRIKGHFGIQREVTERKRAADELRLLRSLLDHANDGIEVIDPASGRFLDVNERACREHGYTREEYLARTVEDIDPWVKRESWPVVARLLEGAGAQTIESTHLRKDGSEFPVEVSCAHITLDREYVLAVVRNTAERRRAAEQLRESEQRYRAIFQSAPDAVLVVQAEGSQAGRIVAANDRAAQMHGLDLAELIGKSIVDLDAPEAARAAPERLRRIAAGERLTFEIEHVRGDGSRFPVEVTAERIILGGQPHVLAFDRDISERRQAEALLRESQQRLALAVASSNLGPWDWNVETGQVVFSAEWKRQLGYEDHEVGSAYEEWESRLHPDDRDRVLAHLHDYLAGRVPEYSSEFRLRHKSGEFRWISTQGTAIRDARGQPLRLLGCHIDITERKRAEAAIRASEERLSAVVRHAPNVAIQWYDEAGRVLLWNEASQRIFGFSAAEAVGRTLDELIHTPEEAAAFHESLAEIRRTGQHVGPTEFTFRRRSGEVGTCVSSIFQIPGEDGRPWFVCMDVDVTTARRAEESRRQLQSQMLHSQKLESLGVLAGGIAHDFNNLLTSMLGFANLAREELPADSPAGPMLGEIVKAAEQAAGLTRQMLDYSGKGKLVVQPVRLDKLVEEMAGLLRTVISRKAAIDLDLKPVTIEADPTQIRQVVMNLITNASDALGGDAGQVSIRTGHLAATAEKLRSPFLPDILPPGNYALLEIGDTGAGIDPAALPRIFDPFYSTKFAGRGLGLAAVLGIIRGHCGTIHVDSRLKAGTRVQVLLPQSAHAVTAPAAELQPSASTRQASILVIEDEDSVRRYVGQVLEGAGFRVQLVSDGLSGLAAIAQASGQFAVVLLDLTMPKMDGWEVLAQLKTTNPQLPVLIISGFSEQEIGRRCVESGARGFLCKPFRPRELLARIEQVLGEKYAEP